MANHDDQFSKRISNKTKEFIAEKDNGIHIFIKLEIGRAHV